MSRLLDILRSNREEREGISTVQTGLAHNQGTLQILATEAMGIENSRPIPREPVTLPSEGLSPLQHGLVMAYVSRVPTKVQGIIPRIPGILGKLSGPLRIIGLDITDEQLAKLKVLEKQPEEIVTSLSAEQLHAIAAALCGMVEHLLEMDRSQGIGTGNGGIGPTGFEQDNRSRGVSEWEINPDRIAGTEETTEQSVIAEPVH